jgi:hypothetical protein
MWPSSPLRPNARTSLDLQHPLLDPTAGDIGLEPRSSTAASVTEQVTGNRRSQESKRKQKKADRSKEIRVVSCSELSELSRHRDLNALKEFGGVEGIAASIVKTLSLESISDADRAGDGEFKRDDLEDRVKRALSLSGVSLHAGLNFNQSTNDLRRQLFGSNRVRQHGGQHSGLLDLLLEALQEDTSILILSFAAISVALGMVECQPAYFDPDPGMGNIGGDSCPLRPLWAGNAPIDLPMARDYPFTPGGGGGGDTTIPCRAWAEGLAAACAVVVAALARAACERWRQGVLCAAMDWERAQAQATVLRGGVEWRIPLEDVQVPPSPAHSSPPPTILPPSSRGSGAPPLKTYPSIGTGPGQFHGTPQPSPPRCQRYPR